MSITERAAKVLAEIDAALALAEKEIAPEFVMPTGYVGLNNKGEHYRAGWHHGAAEYANFIAASRTLLPASLRCLKTAIEGLISTASFKEGEEVDSSFDEPGSAQEARESLTTLCDQWEVPA